MATPNGMKRGGVGGDDVQWRKGGEYRHSRECNGVEGWVGCRWLYLRRYVHWRIWSVRPSRYGSGSSGRRLDGPSPYNPTENEPAIDKRTRTTNKQRQVNKYVKQVSKQVSKRAQKLQQEIEMSRIIYYLNV